MCQLLLKELGALKAHLRAETRPVTGDITQSQCCCGNVSRTGTCKLCLVFKMDIIREKLKKKNQKP